MTAIAPDAPLRTVFAGTPSFAAAILEKLCTTRYRPVAVFTQPAKSSGKKGKGGAVQSLAEQHDIAVLQPENFKTAESLAMLSDFAPDVLIVAAYGLILPPSVLEIPSIDCVNVHASLLPRWRGAAPIERAIMAGDTETGICIMSMEKGLDTGPVYAQQATPIVEDVQTASLERHLADIGGTLLVNVLDEMSTARAQNSALPQPQPQSADGITYAQKIGPEDRKIDWQRGAREIALQIRALAERDPVRCMVQVEGNTVGMQIVEAQVLEQSPSGKQPGTIIASTKVGIDVQCAMNVLRINKLRFEKGKGSLLTPADALNGNASLIAVDVILSS